VHIVSVVGQKGGLGKTLVGLGLAVAGVSKGYSVCVLDLDPQRTAANWGERRGNESPAVVACQVGALPAALEAAEAEGAALCVIDTPGKSNDVAVAAAKVAGLVILPIAPTVFDVETLPHVAEILTLAGSPRSLVVVNRAPPSGRRHVETAEAVAAMGFDVSPHVLYQRAAHVDAGNIGQAAVEFAPDSKAAQEMLVLYSAVTRILEGKPDVKKHARKRS
jgi:chromosome partitioning protein